jgi:hypothetical protein
VGPNFDQVRFRGLGPTQNRLVRPPRRHGAARLASRQGGDGRERTTRSPGASQPLSVSAFARLVGVDEKAVRKAIKNGRLELSVSRNTTGRPMIDPVAGKQEWEENRDPSRVRDPQKSRATRAETGPGDAIRGGRNTNTALPPEKTSPGGSNGHGITTADERRLLIQQQRVNQELKNAILGKKYAPVIEYKRREIARTVRAKNMMLGWPSKAKQRIPSLTIAEVGVLEALVRESLDSLTDPHAEESTP